MLKIRNDLRFLYTKQTLNLLQNSAITTPPSAPLLRMGILKGRHTLKRGIFNCGYNYNLCTVQTRKYCKKKTRAKIFLKLTFEEIFYYEIRKWS